VNTVLVVLIVLWALMLIAALPGWPYPRSWEDCLTRGADQAGGQIKQRVGALTNGERLSTASPIDAVVGKVEHAVSRTRRKAGAAVQRFRMR
jgi:uncharacterized protein YjbJ (UPF0337 family)